MEFRFDLATPADDAAIRRLLVANPMPGQITLGYEREPNYFIGCDTMGPFWQILVARHQPSGEVAAVACRAVRPMWVNGKVRQVGYLSQLRVDARYRGRWIVASGFRKLRELHADGRAEGYLATIIEENREARGILVERPRRHFPAFRERDRLLTLALLLRRSRALPPSPWEVQRGSERELPAIVAFLQRHGASRQFFPFYEEEDFRGTTMAGFQVENFLVARRGGEIAGVMGLWDQSGYKQTVIRGYGGPLRWTRPLVNLAARLGGARPLPAPGEPLRFAYASFICIEREEPALFAALLARGYRLAAERGYAFLMVGLAARDPLLAVARRYPHIPYRSRLYTVCWEDGENFYEELDDRIPYLEIAAL